MKTLRNTLALSLFALLAAAAGCMEAPEESSRKVKAAAVNGATWQNVLAAYEPRKYRIIGTVKDQDGEDTLNVSPAQTWNSAAFEKMSKDGSLKEGFYFDYGFSEEDKFSVEFDGTGKVVGVEQHASMKEILNMGR